jgi:hypothetical protein
MARSLVQNVTGLVTRRNATPAVVQLVTEAGILLTADHPRVPRVADATATIMDALLRAGCMFSAKGHGLRFVLPSGLSPMFLERVGASDGTAYLYGGAAKAAAILAGLPQGCVVSSRIEGKGGLYVTFSPAMSDEDADRVVAFCAATCGMQGKGDGWSDAQGVGIASDAPAYVAPVGVAPPADKPAKGSKRDRKLTLTA